jgi:subtilase family serine protease
MMTSLSAPTTATRGSAAVLADSVTNLGQINSGGFYIGFYLSKDLTIATTDTFLGQRYVSNLAAGATGSANSTVTIPSAVSPGTYYFGAIADNAGTVKETNESNNAKPQGPVTIS